MSFPSAPHQLKCGKTAEEALLYGIEFDTPLGYAAIMAAAAATHMPEQCPCCVVRNAMPIQHRKDILRHELRGNGVVIDINPDSIVGKQVARLLGTDAARPLMQARTRMHVGFANCCKILVSPEEQDVQFTAEDQIRWQLSIDC